MADRNKGPRIIDIVSDYVVLDLETTSKYVNYAEIIEIGALKVANDKPIDSFTTLVKPDFDIPRSATAINNITNEMVKDAPGIREVLPNLLDFIGDSVVIGHNIASFDINIIYDYTQAIYGDDFTNPYIDTLYMARSCLPYLENHKLGTLAEHYNLDVEGEHRALFDCYLTHECYQRMKALCVSGKVKLPVPDNDFSRGSCNKMMPKYSEETKSLQVLQGYLLGITADGVLTDDEVTGLKSWMDDNNSLAGNYPFDVVMKSLDKVLEDGVITQDERDYLLALYKKFTAPVENAEHEIICSLEGVHCCVTGEFEFGERKAVEQYISERGGICDKCVKKATNYVIVGSKGSDAWKHGNYGGKVKKAMELKENGININIISEEDFFKEVEGE